jgi:alpha-beta hydrolase superfamily lysophospholipase
MIEKLQFTCTAEDGLTLQGRSWRDTSVSPKAALLIIHGMTEFCGRYDDFASFLCKEGVIVYSFDLRGHGLTTPDALDRGFFAKKNGVDLILSDIDCVRVKIDEIRAGISAKELPLFIFGHSMGSFITSCYIKRNHAKGWSGVILSGTNAKAGAAAFGKILARMQCFFKGPKSEGKLLDKIAFGTYNSKISPNRTNKDWLTRDESVVDTYIAEPACMFLFKAAGFADLSALLQETGSKNWTQAVPNEVPIYIYCGEMDPVGVYSKGPETLYNWYKETGHNVTFKVYPGGRHEMHNEINRDEVYRDVLSFILLHSQSKILNRGALASGPGENA